MKSVFFVAVALCIGCSTSNLQRNQDYKETQVEEILRSQKISNRELAPSNQLEGSKVFEVQNILVEMGFLQQGGFTSGSYDKPTKDAMFAFYSMLWLIERASNTRDC